jgi:sterol desaturase/sphingolipid hydroxylase (fatty acid hydroxylase superfamily)
MYGNVQTLAQPWATLRDPLSGLPAPGGARRGCGSCMHPFSLEQGPAALRADFVFYGLLVALLAAGMLWITPGEQAGPAAGWVLAGAALWTLAEYVLHRFVLHGVQPFKRWHGLHHARPLALIATPTLLTAALFALFVFAPAWWLAPSWQGAAVVLGVMLGYLAYIVTHHVVHHAHGGGRWLRQHKRWHALHHKAGSQACYGVSLALWDHVFRSAQPQR